MDDKVECQLCLDYHDESEMQEIELDGKILIVGKKCFAEAMEKAAAYDHLVIQLKNQKKHKEN
jgi:hypothetical protein